jgi:acyl carrier protein
MNEKAKQIEEFIRDEIHAGDSLDAIPSDQDLLASELIDSLGIVQLVSFLDTTFGVAVADDELTPENFQTIDAIVGFVEQRGG